MNPRFKFRRFKQREDIGEIKDNCTRDSISFKDPSEYNTLYTDTYHNHPVSAREMIPPPPTSVNMGGGTFNPTREETRTHYMNTYHSFDKSAIPKLALAPKDSDIIPNDAPLPKLSSAHAGMNEYAWKRADLERDVARQNYMNHHYKHFEFGDDRTNYESTFSGSYSARNQPKREIYDSLHLRKSSVDFDKKAGLGPHDKSLTKRKSAPEKPDAEYMDQRTKNFDIGYTGNDYATTTRQSYQPLSARRPPKAGAPPCAELANHGKYAPPWASNYSKDFVQREPIQNEIDINDLKRAHFDPGHEKNDWPVPEPPKTVRREKNTQNLHASNIVFKGDGGMVFNTTQKDTVGIYDKSQDGRQAPNPDCWADHQMVGADNVNYRSTAKDANNLAGTGKAAESAENLYKNRGVMFARGGDWDQFAGKDPVDLKKYKPVEPAQRVDGSYYRKAHFDLEATTNYKPRYSTTYYKTICKPSIET